MPDLNPVHPGAASHPVPSRLEPFAAGYAVTGLPARLLGVPFPHPAFFAEEDLSGVRWVACLSSSEPERRYAVPAGIGWLERCRFGGPESAGPAEWAEFARVARAVRARLRAGEGVLVHCDQGLARTGTVVGSVLALEGIAPARAAAAIATVAEAQQPGWVEAGRFAAELTAWIERTLAHAGRAPG